MLLGSVLAGRLGVSKGDSVSLITLGGGTLTPLGVMPIPKTVTVVGTFEFGFYEFDSSSAFMSLEAAERSFRKAGRISFSCGCRT